MFKKLEAAEKRNDELSTLLSDPNVVNNPKEYAKLAKEQSDLQELVNLFHEYQQLEVGAKDAEEILADGVLQENLEAIAMEYLYALYRISNQVVVESGLDVSVLPNVEMSNIDFEKIIIIIWILNYNIICSRDIYILHCYDIMYRCLFNF